MEGLSIGSNVIRLDVTGPDNVKISDVSTEKISITIDEWVSVSKEIDVLFSGDIEEQKEPLVVEKSRESVYVSGAKTLVERVDKVYALVDVEKVGNELETLDANLQATDASGNVVDYVYLDTESINVTSIMHHLKTVNLEVPVENEIAGGMERTIELPKTIVIKGEDSVLADIETITCNTIDLSQYEEDTSVKLEPILPYGIEVGSDSEELYAEVKVKELSQNSIKINKDDIKINNTSEDLKYELKAEGIYIEVTGKEADILSLSASDFNIYVDVQNLEAGTHTVDLIVETDKDLASVKVSKEQIEIIIE